MEATVLLKAADLLFRFLSSPISTEIKSIWKYEEEIRTFKNTMGVIRDALSDVEAKQFKEDSVTNAYKRLREAFLDAEDFLDRFETHKMQLQSDPTMLKKVRRFFTGSNPVKYAKKVHDEMKENGKKLNAIAHDLHKFAPSERTIKEARRVPETYSFVITDNIIGRDDDKRKLMDLLLGCSADQTKIPIVSIVGIGGMGKSTLAKLVYNDESGLESGQFALKLWVSDSSREFDLKLLLQKILLCISPADTNLPNLGVQELINRLKREIGGQKYLLVLDDVQNESRENWLELEDLLKAGNKESRILVTTRSRKVAMVMDSASTYELQGLSTSDSWKLFENMAFSGSKDPELIEIGKVIVKKCSQVPLALKTIGCLLFRQDKRKWEHFRDVDLAKVADESNDLMPILRISYDNLDRTVKKCFQYCALLPKNAIISREILICIWMANDCVKANESQAAEDVCEDNLKILHNRCFIEEAERNEWGDVTHFRMHDLMHELAKDVAGAEMFVVDSASNLVLKENVRHLNLKSTIDIVDRISTFEPKNTRLRTLLHHDVFTWRNPWQKLLSIEKLMSEYRVLRMLDLQKWRIESLPNSVGELIHLRYLNLSYNEFKTLPDAIVELCNLPSLLLKSCTNLKELPKGTRKLINLRHLNLEGCNVLTQMPSGMGALTSLRTLNRFIVGPQKSKDSASLEDLEPLSKLQGDLMIQLSETMALNKQGDDGALLLNKRLQKLRIEWLSCRSEKNIEWPSYRYRSQREIELQSLRLEHMKTFAKLQPHSDLEDFTLYGYEHWRFPLWVPMDDLASVLPNLVSILIDQCTGCRHLPSFSKLCCLKRLTLCNLWNLEYIEKNTSTALFFPSLEYLWLMELPYLEGWRRPLSLADGTSSLLPPFPHLSDLYIYGCPYLTMTSMPLQSITKFFLKGFYIEAAEKKGSALSHEPDFEKNDLAAAYTSTQFHTNDLILLLSIPWEQYCQRYLRGNPVSLVLKETVHDFYIEATNSNEGFSGMSNHLISLEIKSKEMPGIISDILFHLTALQELHIVEHMPVKNEDFISPNAIQDHGIPWGTFQKLQLLSLWYITEMERLPTEIRFLTFLQELRIKECHNFAATSDEFPWKGLKSLQRLSLIHLPKMERLPEGIQFLSSLEKLHIEDFFSLAGDDSEMPWRGLQSLEHLSLIKLRTMERLLEGIQFLTSLQKLHIEDSHNLTGNFDPEMPWIGLQSLQHLSLINLQKMERLPQGMHLLTSLQELHIEKCHNLTATSDDELPWKGLQSLHCLSLIHLPKMERLPQAIQFLTSLMELCIKDCENLTIPKWVNLDILR